MSGPFVTFVFPVFGDIAGGGVENTEAGDGSDGHVLQQPKLVGVGGGDSIIAQRFPLVTPNQSCMRREQLGAVILVGITDTAPGTADIDGFRCVAQDTVQLLIIQAAYQPLDFAGGVAEFLTFTAKEGADAFVQLFNFVFLIVAREYPPSFPSRLAPSFVMPTKKPFRTAGRNSASLMCPNAGRIRLFSSFV